MQIVHWASSSKGRNPFLGVRGYSSNTGGVGLVGTVHGIWAVPYSPALQYMWCRSEIQSPGHIYPARDLMIVADVPQERIVLYKRGTPCPNIRDSSLWRSLCIDDDNGLVVNEIREEEILSVKIGRWIDEQMVLSDWLD